LRLVEGLVRAVVLLPDGRRQIVGFSFAGDMLWVGGGVDPSIMEAVTPSVLLEYPADTLLRAAVCNRFIAADLTSALRVSSAFVREHSVILGRCTAIERVAWFALLMRDRLGGEDRFVLPMPRPDIADYLGLTVETLSRSLGRLRKMGVIDCYRQTVEILDPARLRSVAPGDPGHFGGSE
jgi:CRP-like cAMP-binding protein